MKPHLAVGVLDDARGFRGVRLCFAQPLVTAGDAFMSIGVFHHLGHFAHRAGGFAHVEKAYPDSEARLNRTLGGGLRKPGGFWRAVGFANCPPAGRWHTLPA